MLRIVAAVFFVISFLAAESSLDDVDDMAHHDGTLLTAALGGAATHGPIRTAQTAHTCHDLSCTQSLAIPDRYVFLPRSIGLPEHWRRPGDDPHAAFFERDPPVPRTVI